MALFALYSCLLRKCKITLLNIENVIQGKSRLVWGVYVLLVMCNGIYEALPLPKNAKKQVYISRLADIFVERTFYTRLSII